MSAIHNALLAEEVAELNLSGLRLRLADVNEVFTALRVASPGTALVPAIDVLRAPFELPDGQLRPMSACLFIDPAYCVDVPAHALGPNALIIPEMPAAKFLFWDILHPTTDAHRALGQYLYEQLPR